MTPVNNSARIVAVVFALGLSLAGPQAVGIASADRGGPADSSASDGQQSRPRERASGIRSHARQSRPASSVVPARADKPGNRILEISDGGNDPGGVTIKGRNATPSRSGSQTKPRWRSGTLDQNPPRVSDVPDDPPADTAAAVGSAAAGDGIAPVPVTVPSDAPRPTPLAAAVAQTEDGIATLGVKVAQAVSRFGDWLSSLPANPLTDFASGALLLVRRTFNLPTIPKVSVDNVAVLESTAESPQQAVFTVTLGRAYDSAVTVGYATVESAGPDAAVAGADYVPVSGVLTFAPGETSQEVAVEVLSDAIEEAPETFGLNVTTAFPSSTNVDLGGAEGAIVGASWGDPFRLTITNLTFRDLSVNSNETIAPGRSRQEQAERVYFFLGSPNYQFSGTNAFWSGPGIDFKIDGASSRLLLGVNDRLEYLAEVPQPGWWDQFLAWAGLKILPEATPWVREAGFKSVEIKRLPDATETYSSYGNEVTKKVTVVEIVVR